MVPLPPSVTVRLNATVPAPLNRSTVNSARSLRTATVTASAAYTGTGSASTSRAVLRTAWRGDRAVAAIRPSRAAPACARGRRSARTRTRSPAASVNGRSTARCAQVVVASRTSAAAARRRTAGRRAHARGGRGTGAGGGTGATRRGITGAGTWFAHAASRADASCTGAALGAHAAGWAAGTRTDAAGSVRATWLAHAASRADAPCTGAALGAHAAGWAAGTRTDAAGSARATWFAHAASCADAPCTGAALGAHAAGWAAGTRRDAAGSARATWLAHAASRADAPCTGAALGAHAAGWAAGTCRDAAGCGTRRMVRARRLARADCTRIRRRGRNRGSAGGRGRAAAWSPAHGQKAEGRGPARAGQRRPPIRAATAACSRPATCDARYGYPAAASVVQNAA